MAENDTVQNHRRISALPAVPLLLAIVPWILTACAHGHGASTGEPAECLLEPGDTVYLADGPVFRECAVDEPARLLTPNARVDYRPDNPALVRNSFCYIAELDFVVGRDGRPERRTARVTKANDPGWGRAVLESLALWRYEPAVLSGSRVRQIVHARRVTSIVLGPVNGGRRPTSPPPNCR